jgi:peptidoglycan/xylan/chitin deacetylase (PgdA/CDA1 family)
VRVLIAALEALAPDARDALLAAAADVLAPEPRTMIDAGDLRALADAGIAIGSHGFSHAPLTRVDARAELAATRALLKTSLAPHADVPALAFPHGKFDDAAIRNARELGIELMFTSMRTLAPTFVTGPGLIGRVGLTAASIADASADFRPDLLALQLFGARHAP